MPTLGRFILQYITIHTVVSTQRRADVSRTVTIAVN